ncbi:MAG: DNA-binding protein [Rubrivivax sp.]|nr:DNA-binding protein [Rubrivivax sp.]
MHPRNTLDPLPLRLAGAEAATVIDEDAELLTLSATVGAGGLHLHACVAIADGRVIGGNVSPGCRVCTTAELVLRPRATDSVAREAPSPEVRRRQRGVVVHRVALQDQLEPMQHQRARRAGLEGHRTGQPAHMGLGLGRGDHDPGPHLAMR